MKASITVKDIAEEAAVSISTVSLVVNGQFHRVSPETRQRVENIIERLGYTPNRVARNLRRQDTSTIGVITAAISHSVFGDIAEAVEESAAEQSFQVLIARAENPKRELAAVGAMISSQVSGIIFISHSEKMSNQALDALAKAEIPFIVVNRWLENEAYHRIYWDNRQGVREAVAHLANKGHRRIAYMGDDSLSLRKVERLEGYYQEMQRRNLSSEGLALNEGYIRTNQMITKLLALPADKRPTALVLEDDNMAVGVMQIARSLSINIPEDLAIIGFTDREFAPYLMPSLTTVSLPVRDVGRLSANTLFQLLKEKPEAAVQPVNLKVSCRLVIRRSCGCLVS